MSHHPTPTQTGAATWAPRLCVYYFSIFPVPRVHHTHSHTPRQLHSLSYLRHPRPPYKYQRHLNKNDSRTKVKANYGVALKRKKHPPPPPRSPLSLSPPRSQPSSAAAGVSVLPSATYSVRVCLLTTPCCLENSPRKPWFEDRTRSSNPSPCPNADPVSFRGVAVTRAPGGCYPLPMWRFFRGRPIVLPRRLISGGDIEPSRCIPDTAARAHMFQSERILSFFSFKSVFWTNKCVHLRVSVRASFCTS